MKFFETLIIVLEPYRILLRSEGKGRVKAQIHSCTPLLKGHAPRHAADSGVKNGYKFSLVQK
jgi:hypothetical protein